MAFSKRKQCENLKRELRRLDQQRRDLSSFSFDVSEEDRVKMKELIARQSEIWEQLKALN